MIPSPRPSTSPPATTRPRDGGAGRRGTGRCRPAVAGWAAALAALLAPAPDRSAHAAGAPEHILGIHAHEPQPLAQSSTAFGAIRLWDSGTAWRRLEPARGRWDFTRLDRYLDADVARGRTAMLTLGSTPEWASSRPDEACAYGKGCAAPPRDLADWRNYVDVVSRRYRSRIECYEIWNEVRFHHGEDPADRGGDPMFFSGTLDELVELTRSAARIIRANDPQACILSPSFHNASPDWVRNLDRFLQRGGAELVDGISFHFYGRMPEQTLGALRAVRQTLARRGLAGLPIWNTEFGFDIPVFARPGDSVEDTLNRLGALIARSAILDASEGVSRSYWYALDNRNMGIVHQLPDPLPWFDRVMQAIASLLGSHRFSDCGPHDGGLWTCTAVQAGSGSRNIVAWSASPDYAAVCIEDTPTMAGTASRQPALPGTLLERHGGRTCVGPVPVLLAGPESTTHPAPRTP